jgi:aryl-alcohol dehydrogenase-like predicted oxidoreductase
MASISKIALGTVQFGLSYGVANVEGQLSSENVLAILSLAKQAGIDTLDTAIAYGESEACLGQVGVHDWRVVSKLPPLPGGCANVEAWVDESLTGSLQRLGMARLYGLLLHRSADLLGADGEELFCALLRAKESDQVRKIGVSVYDPKELQIVTSRFEIDLVQAPYNVFDRRIQESGWLGRLRQSAIEVHVRSVFLQGLLLMPKIRRPEAFARWEHLFARWDNWLRETNTSALSSCLHFSLSQPEIDRVIVGVDSTNHLKEILTAAQERSLLPPALLTCEDTQLINPSNWKLQ